MKNFVGMQDIIHYHYIKATKILLPEDRRKFVRQREDYYQEYCFHLFGEVSSKSCLEYETRLLYPPFAS